MPTMARMSPLRIGDNLNDVEELAMKMENTQVVQIVLCLHVRLGKKVDKEVLRRKTEATIRGLNLVGFPQVTMIVPKKKIKKHLFWAEVTFRGMLPVEIPKHMGDLYKVAFELETKANIGLNKR